MNHSIKSLRKDCLSIFQSGINAADPYQAVKDCLFVAENHFEITLGSRDSSNKRLGRWQKIRVIAFGKAACKMAEAANDVIPNHRLAAKPIAITNYENAENQKKSTLNKIEVIGASHPLPDKVGEAAAEKVIKQLKNTSTDELVLVLISGGGSALIPYPANGISLDDKIVTTKQLLASGATINQINCVRKHLSRLKGGRLAQLIAPADLHTLILSDVMGDDLDAIASGPTVADNTSFADAIKILKDYQVWNTIPETVKQLLDKGIQGIIPETPKSNDIAFKNTSHTIVASNSISLKAITGKAEQLAYKSTIYSEALFGEASEVAEQLVLFSKQLIKKGLKQPTAILAGGETTVTLSGTGSGGRNQEMALAFAIAAEKHQLKGKWVFLSAGTDGRDGPTDAAGGLVDPDTLKRITKARANPINRLNNNDSYAALKKSQDLVIIGATGTNVADLQILLIQPELHT